MATPLSTQLKWEIANPLWASSLNPLLANPFNSVQIISKFSLVAGINIINHMLGRTLLGWFITDIDGIASIYRSAPFNALTLTLTVSAPVVVNLGVY